MDIEIESPTGPCVARKAYIAAIVACTLVIVAGAIVLNEQLRFARLAHVAIDENAVSGLWANRVIVSAVQCRRYEKETFINLNDVPTRNRYVQKWTKSWGKLHDNLEHLTAAGLPQQEQQKVDSWAAAAEGYRQHFLEVISLIQEGALTRPEDANHASKAFKNDLRVIIAETTRFADAKVAQASQSGGRLTHSVLLSIILTCILIVVPSGIIIVWTVWLTREMIAHNNDVAAARRATESANRSNGEFLAHMSHDLRTPMTAILGFSDIIVHAPRGEHVLEAARTIKRNGEQLLTIIKGIPDLSKTEVGGQNVEVTNYSPRQFVRDMV